jgi:hypothetical protein
MTPKIRNQILLLLAYLFVGGAIVTLVPASGRVESDLGYHSLCPFAPWSTLLLLMVAGLLAAIRTYMLSRTD